LRSDVKNFYYGDKKSGVTLPLRFLKGLRLPLFGELDFDESVFDFDVLDSTREGVVFHSTGGEADGEENKGCDENGAPKIALRENGRVGHSF
jgi:hypothetical protein